MCVCGHVHKSEHFFFQALLITHEDLPGSEGGDKTVGAGADFGCLLALLTFQICVRVFRRTFI